MFYLKIPPDRIAILIGKEGKVKEYLEKMTGVKIKVDSKTGDVVIDPQDRPYEAYKVRNVIKAIGYGFPPKKAAKLLNDNYVLEVIDVKDYSRRKERIETILGRVIGTKGRAKREFEDLTGTDLSIYDHYVSMIGDFEDMEIARRAMQMLISGSKHESVYRYIKEEKRRKAFRERRIITGL